MSHYRIHVTTLCLLLCAALNSAWGADRKPNIVLIFADDLELIDDLLAWFDSAGALLPEKANPKYDAKARQEADRKARGKK